MYWYAVLFSEEAITFVQIDHEHMIKELAKSSLLKKRNWLRMRPSHQGRWIFMMTDCVVFSKWRNITNSIWDVTSEQLEFTAVEKAHVRH